MKILAAIILFNPDIQRLLNNIHLIAAQVDHVLLVDNASKNRDSLLQLGNENITFLQNQKNLGLPRTFNRMLSFARENNFDNLLLLDQDSVCAENLICEYKKHLEKRSVCLVPYLIHRNNDYNEHYKIHKNGDCEIVETSINSGTLINLNLLPLDLKFDESFFVDCVDYDFFKQLKKRGLSTIRVNTTNLLIDLGNLKTHYIMGKRFFSNNYSTFRLQIQVQDRIKFFKKYGFDKDTWQVFVISSFSILMILFFEKQKIKKTAAIIKGFFKGLFAS